MEAGTERPPWVPEHIGPYRILRTIGSGGMGIVFEAEQELPDRRVAIKVLRPGHGSRSLLRRFRVEAQALGRLTHPGIARIYGSGSVESPLGPLHYFVLELVRGERLTDWARERNLDERDASALMADVTDAVHEAHLRSVVHRDLKPANILVDASGAPRVLDFGVALLTDRDVQATARTLTGQLVGTLPYMSPEQASGGVDEIDLRTDVYALGCVLYELLGGRAPFDPGQPQAQLLQAITAAEPAPLGSFVPGIDRDLETIVAKAMAKEKSERYSSAAALAADLRRFLAYEPIEARPHSALYQLKRYAKRNRVQLVFASVAVLAVLVGAVASLVFALGERRAEEVAEARREDLALRRERQALLGAAEFVRSGLSRRAETLLDEVRPERRAWEWHLLDAFCTPPVRTVAEVDGKLYFSNVSEDGQRFLCGGPLGELLLADTRTAAITPFALGEGVRGLCLEKTGSRFAAVTHRDSDRIGTLHLWQDGALRILDQQPADTPWNATAFSPSGDALLWTWEDGALRVYDLPAGTPRLVVQADERPIADALFTPDGRTIVTRGHRATEIRLWDAVTGRPRGVVPTVPNHPADIAVDPSGTLLFDLTIGEPLRVWELATGEAWAPEPRVAPEPLVCESIAFAPDGDRFYVATEDAVHVYSAAERRRVARFDTGVFQLREFVLSRDGALLAGRSRWSSVLVLDAETGRSGVLPTAIDRAWDLRFVDDDRTLWLVDEVGKLSSLELDGALSSFPGHADEVGAAAFLWNGELLVSASRDGTVSAWDPDSAAPVATLAAGLPALRALCALPGGERVAVAGVGVVALLGTGPGTEDRTLEGSEGSTWWSLACSTDGERLFAASPGTLAAWNLESGALLGRAATSANGVLALAPDGEQLVLGDTEGGLHLFDAATLEHGRTLRGHLDDVTRIAFSPDGELLVSAAADSYVLVRDARTGDEVARLFVGLRPEGPREIGALCFTPDGTRLAAGGVDGRLFLWETDDWELVLELDGHSGAVHDLVFRPDAVQLVSASADTRLGLWDLRAPRERIELARRRAAWFANPAGSREPDPLEDRFERQRALAAQRER